MSENIAQTVQKVIQDLVAPDLRELKVILAANQKQTDLRFSSQDEKSASLQENMDQRFDAVDAKFTGLQKQTDQRSEAVDEKFAGLQKQMDQRFDAQDQVNGAQFRALIAAISEVKAQSDLNTVQAIAALSERVAILESRRQ